VASKKDKLIEEAQRLVVQGKLDKAIKAYEQVMEIDPSSQPQRQKLAELLLRTGRNDDARAQFETIGKNLSSNGFYLKAIAIYKQIQRIFPGDIPITLTLAGLNEKHGLVANALAEYRQIFDAYEKSSDREEALKILEKMSAIDPQNIAIGLKLAETYFQLKRTDDSYAAFGKLASMVQERGDTAAFAKLDARIRQLFPEKAEFMLEVLAEQISSGNAATAVNTLQGMLRTNPNDKRIWELIVDAYKKLNQPQKVMVAYQHYLKFFPEEVSAKTGLISCHASQKDLKGTLALLDSYEPDLLSSGQALDDLEAAYKKLEELDPINERVLDGLSRVYKAAGKTKEFDALAPKLQSLRSISGKKAPVPKPRKETVFSEPDHFEESSASGTSENSVFSQDSTELSDNVFDLDSFGEDTTEPGFDSAFNSEPPEQSAFGEVNFAAAAEEPSEEFEIEVEYDDFDTSSTSPIVDEPAPKEVSWLDSVGEILDSISTSPRGVKFGGGADTADAQSHYDLGMAFKEMGLYDEAINEFRQASADPERQIECIIFQGACLRDKGDVKNADKVLRALLNPALNQEDFLSTKYELALTTKIAHNSDEYARLLAEIEAASPGYRDVRSLIAAIGTNKDDLDFSEDDLKDFDF
jgi:tetratricopeptide (TPR) repeat protein